MNDHVTPEIADFLHRRLPADRMAEVQRHVEACAACAAEMAFAERFQQQAIAEDAVHLHPDRVIALAAAPTPSASEQRHLDACDSCRGELEWALRRPGEPSRALGDADHARAGWARRFSPKLWIPGVAVAAAVALLLIVRPGEKDHGIEPAALAHIAPLPVLISRSPVEPGSFQAVRLRGFELYRDADYEAARAQLNQALALKPDDAEMLLYLGSSELLLGRTDRAVELLQRGVAQATPPALGEELHWQLANALLASGAIDDARSELRHVVDAGRRHQGEATRLLEQVGP
jgi:tetratricopeptide (TPR) repeat protein